MILSRTSRIMLGFLLLALASFLWVNFLVGVPSYGFDFLRAAPAPTAGVVERPEAVAAQPAAPVAPVAESQVARELEVLDLPFLVTEPPAEGQAPVQEAEGQGAPPAQAARRATVNPFSPILPGGGAAAQAAQTPAAAPQMQQQPRTITEVPIPSGPPRTAAPATSAQSREAAPKAPVPAPTTPSAHAGTSLPRALPGGTLGGTPDVLRSAIGATEVPQGTLGRVAAVREPQESQPTLKEAGTQTVSGREPQPLAEPVAEPAPQQAAEAVRPDGRAPLAAGTSSLSRYLRDHDVRFTGSVIGPVSVGVFRTSAVSAPIVISLGQTLPDTSIVLTDLRGQQAELTLGDNTQILTLELRR